jgi:hypothetical protein
MRSRSKPDRDPDLVLGGQLEVRPYFPGVFQQGPAALCRALGNDFEGVFAARGGVAEAPRAGPERRGAGQGLCPVAAARAVTGPPPY